MNKIVIFFRKNATTSLMWAIIVGLIFRYLFGMTKDLMWLSWDVTPIYKFINPKTPSQVFFFTVTLNATVDISSSIPAAFICGALLAVVLREKGLVYGLCSAVVYFLFSARLWHFMAAPNLEIKISVVLGRILSACTLMVAIWLVLKIKGRWMPASP